jgi:formate hydrogenlyase subunit 3/multisubunit Na+/H+ antiporter MnhD subunit
MELIQNNIFLFIGGSPLLSALLMWILPPQLRSGLKRHMICLIPLFLWIIIFFQYCQNGFLSLLASYPWYPWQGISFTLRLDFLSMFFIGTTTILIFLLSIFAGGGNKRNRSEWVAILVLEFFLFTTILTGTFSVLIVFFDVSLLTFLLILATSYDKRIKANVLQFAAIQLIGTLLLVLALSEFYQSYFFLAGLMIKVSCFPFHNSALALLRLLKGTHRFLLYLIMLIVGIYGMLRFSPLFLLDVHLTFLSYGIAVLLFSSCRLFSSVRHQEPLLYILMIQCGVIMIGIALGERQSLMGALSYGLQSSLVMIALIPLIFSKNRWAIFFLILCLLGIPGTSGFFGVLLITEVALRQGPVLPIMIIFSLGFAMLSTYSLARSSIGSRTSRFSLNSFILILFIIIIYNGITPSFIFKGVESLVGQTP